MRRATSAATDTHSCASSRREPPGRRIGLRDLVVVETDDAVLVARKDRVQDVRKHVVARLKADRPLARHSSHRGGAPPWGSYDTVESGARFQVKRLKVGKPGAAAVACDLHHHRADTGSWWWHRTGHRATTCSCSSANQSTYIPVGVKRRLENPGSQNLRSS